MSVCILAIDAATVACSAALMIDNNINERFIIAPYEHTYRILSMVHNLLEETGISLKNLDALAFGRGPGSFTGIRIATGIAKGLSLGANLPLIGISTLATLAQGAWRQTGALQVLTVIDACKGKVFVAKYQRHKDNTWLGEDTEKIMTIEELSVLINTLSGDWSFSGIIWKNYASLAKTKSISFNNGRVLLPASQDIISLALNKWKNGDIISINQAEPIYLYNNTIMANTTGLKLNN